MDAQTVTALSLVTRLVLVTPAKAGSIFVRMDSCLRRNDGDKCRRAMTRLVRAFELGYSTSVPSSPAFYLSRREGRVHLRPDGFLPTQE
jgi:hypothetical protein